MKAFQAAQDHRQLFLDAVKADSKFVALDDRVTRCLSVPRSYAGLWSNLDRIRSLLPHLEAIIPTWDFPATLRAWVDRVAQIEVGHEFCQVPILQMPTMRSSREGGVSYPSQVFKGIQRTHAIWVTIWYQYRGGGAGDDQAILSQSYDFMVAQLLAAYAQIADRGDLPSAELRPYQASTLIFRLHTVEDRDAFDQWQKSPRDIKSQFDFFKTKHAEHGDLAQGFGATAELINEGFMLRQPSVFRPRSVSNLGRKPVRAGLDHLSDEGGDIWVWQADPEDGDPVGFSPIPIELRTPGKVLQKQMAVDGLNPLEYSDDAVVWIAAEDLKDPPHKEAERKLAPLSSLYAAARGRQRAEIMSAQLFRTRLARTRPIDMCRLVRAFNDCYKNGAGPGNGGYSLEMIRETLRFYAVMVVTGARPEAVRELLCINRAEDIKKNSWALAYSTKWKVWLHPYLPPERKPLAFKYRQAAVSTWPRIVRSDIWSVGRALGEPQKGVWFHHDVADYEAVYKTAIAPVLHRAGLAEAFHALKRLPDLMYSWFMGNDEGDQLRVSVLFDRDAASCETQHFYTAFDRSALDQHFSRAMEKFWDLMLRNEPRLSGDLFSLGNRTEIPQTFCGDDYTPRLDSITALVTEMKLRLAMKLYPPWSDEQHNLLTAYLALGLAVVTGFRSARTPIPDLSLIDPETGFLPLQEKDRKDSAHSRLTWIPPLLRRQVEHYLEHLRGMAFNYLAKGSTSITVPATSHRDRSRYNSDSYPLSLLRTLYFVKRDKSGRIRPQELTGQQLMTVLNGMVPNQWPIPNAGRHFLRTYLVEAGCPTVVTNSLFGHWHIGEASWGGDSALDPYRYRHTLAPYLETLLAQLGYIEIGNR